MRRLISIAMVAVLAGWLAIPLAGAHFSACNMICCRRTVAKPHCSHMEDMEASGSAQSGPEVYAGSKACPGKCCVKGTSIQFGLAVPGLASIFSAPKFFSPFLSSISPWLRPQYSRHGRAPPHTV